MGPSRTSSAQPALPEAYKTGKSNCVSVAPKLSKRSKISLWTRSGSESFLSTLLITTIGDNPKFNALEVTNFV